jgi:hypothetical protein
MAPPLRLPDSSGLAAGYPQRFALLLAERPHDLLHFLPGRDTGTDRDLEALRNVHRLGAASRAAKAQVEVRAMLGARLTVTSGAPTASVRLGQGPEDHAWGQLLESPEEDPTAASALRH